MRFKNRYLLCELQFNDQTVDQALNGGYLFRLFQNALEAQIGDWGMGCLQQSFSVKYYNAFTGLLILRVARDHYRLVWGCLRHFNSIKQKRCTIKCLHVGGTIRSCQKQAIIHNRRVILENDPAKILTPAQIAQNKVQTTTTETTIAAAACTANPGAPVAQALLVESATGLFTVVKSEQTAQQLTAAEAELARLEDV